MIHLVISGQKDFRIKEIKDIISLVPENEVIVFDDTYGEFVDLEQYLFPSLFNTATPIVHIKYIISDNTKDINQSLIKKMVASPTVFIFEEIDVPKSFITNMKKIGAFINHQELKSKVKKENNFFKIANTITSPNKKLRWMAYIEAVKESSIEAILGILYWKIRDEISKSKGQEKDKYKKIYKDLIHAHSTSYQKGAPLELLVEKVIIEI